MSFADDKVRVFFYGEKGVFLANEFVFRLVNGPISPVRLVLCTVGRQDEMRGRSRHNMFS